jgi:TatD DNase family protein
MLTDTHCHLDDPRFLGRLSAVFRSAAERGVTRMVVPGVSASGWPRIAELAAACEAVFPAFGLHPLHSGRFDDGLLEGLAAIAGTGVAIGEIGLDYQAGPGREIQQRAFREQLRLARRLGLPVIIHCRKAFSDLLAILREEPGEGTGGVMHAFSGSVETARECIRLGFAIGAAGPVTFRNAVRPLQVVKAVPLEHLLLETDAPDLAPEPYRGKCNEPAYLPEIARKVAEIKGISYPQVARITTINASRIFNFNRKQDG